MRTIILSVLLFIFCDYAFAQRAGTRAVSRQDTITTSSKIISVSSSLRMSETLINTSLNNLYVSFDSTAVIGKGFLIRPFGSITYGAFTLIQWNGVVSAIAESDTVFITKTTVYIN